MKVLERVIDIELTNRCNALCSFCPRDQTPEQGFMSFDIFKQVILRIKELEMYSQVTLTGQGESTLHPQLVEFVAYAYEQGVSLGMTTNGNLLTKDKSAALLEAGLAYIAFSVSDMDDDYELVYNLNFEKTRTNILDFIDLKERLGVKDFITYISVVEHDINREKLDEIEEYWISAGADSILNFQQSNRGGACDNGHYFIGTSKYHEQAIQTLQENKISTLCAVPYNFVFIGWNGQYYICCSDYKKEVPLGSVFEHDIDSMDTIKMKSYLGGLKPCAECNSDPINKIRELYYEIENGDATSTELQAELDNLKDSNIHRLPVDIDILKWDIDSRVGYKSET